MLKTKKNNFIVKRINDKVLTPTLYACFLIQNIYSDFEEYCKVVKEQIKKNNNKS